MHDIEPYYSWIDHYNAAEDELSPFYQREYSEIEFTHVIYDHFIHPQWDEIGSPTLFIKILFTDYEKGFCIIELMGEWNDCLHNDIMYLKRNIVETLIYNGINKFILIGENLFNFHYSDDSYYEEWYQEVEHGYIVCLNFRDHVIREMETISLQNYMMFNGIFEDFNWRKYNPYQLFSKIDSFIAKRLSV